MMFFASRSAARSFAAKGGKKVVDCGSSFAVGRRWGVKVL